MSYVVNMEPYMMSGNAEDNPILVPSVPSTLRRRKPFVNSSAKMLANQTKSDSVAVATTPVYVTGNFTTPQTSSVAHGLLKESPAVGSDTFHHQEASHQQNAGGRFGMGGDGVASVSSATDQKLTGDAKLKQKIPDGEGGSQDDARMDPISSLNKRIFLSYSGHQRPFAEQLFLDLKNAGYSPFFDQDSGSLPKGEEFPGRILQAARECHVAVVVLSQDYLHSKWPMLELAAFVKAKQSFNPKLKILPLFYKLQVSDLKDEVARRELLDRWTVLANQDLRIALLEWIAAIDTLPRINGLVFCGGSEVEYRNAILKSLYSLCCPGVQFKLPDMDGKERWCKIVERELEKVLEAKHPLLGLYGMGGLGKTLLCKALCNYFHHRFDGKVCYVDFCSGSPMEMKKEILTRLTNMDERLLDTIRYEEECDSLLEVFLPQQDVFLAIDNLCYSTLPDAGRISKSLGQIFGFLTKESMSIVTSKSLEMLRGALSMDTTHICMPTLTEDEAMNIFVRMALLDRTLSSLSEDELEVVKTCLSRCAFLQRTYPSTDFQYRDSRVYHPMALRALGYSLMRVDGHDPLEWARQEKIPERLSDDDLDDIYKILKQGYNALDVIEKLLFMDVAVFAPREKLWNPCYLWQWLAGVHGISQRDVQNKLRKLEIISLLEIKQDGSVTLHDLYKEFARYELEIEAEKRRCVYTMKVDALPWCLESTAPGACWPDLKRVKLHSSHHEDFESSRYWWFMPDEGVCLRIPGGKLREWANLQVLHLEFAGEHIDIGPLKCLRALVLVATVNLKTFTCSNHLEQLRFVTFKCFFSAVTQVPTFTSTRLEELQMSFGMGALQRPFTFHLQASALTVLKFFGWYSKRQDEDLNLERYPNLIELYMNSEFPDHGLCRLSLTGLGLSAPTKLRKLYLRSIPIEGPLLELQNLTSLEYLEVRLCYNIRYLSGLGCLINLKKLNVSGTSIQDLDGVEKLMKLEQLFCINCKCLRRLPDLSSLPSLWILDVKGCDLLESYSVSENCTVPSEWEQGTVPQNSRPDDWIDLEHAMLCKRQTLGLTEDNWPILGSMRSFLLESEERLVNRLEDPSVICHLEAMERQRAKDTVWHTLTNFFNRLWELTLPYIISQTMWISISFTIPWMGFFIRRFGILSFLLAGIPITGIPILFTIRRLGIPFELVPGMLILFIFRVLCELLVPGILTFFFIRRFGILIYLLSDILCAIFGILPFLLVGIPMLYFLL